MTINLAAVCTKADFHALVKEQLHFPDWYGPSWDAFWDAIVAVVEMPDRLEFQHWQGFAAAAPQDLLILRRIIVDYQELYPQKQLILAD